MMIKKWLSFLLLLNSAIAPIAHASEDQAAQMQGRHKRLKKYPMGFIADEDQNCIEWYLYSAVKCLKRITQEKLKTTTDFIVTPADRQEIEKAYAQFVAEQEKVKVPVELAEKTVEMQCIVEEYLSLPPYEASVCRYTWKRLYEVVTALKEGLYAHVEEQFVVLHGGDECRIHYLMHGLRRDAITRGYLERGLRIELRALLTSIRIYAEQSAKLKILTPQRLSVVEQSVKLSKDNPSQEVMRELYQIKQDLAYEREEKDFNRHKNKSEDQFLKWVAGSLAIFPEVRDRGYASSGHRQDLRMLKRVIESKIDSISAAFVEEVKLLLPLLDEIIETRKHRKNVEVFDQLILAGKRIKLKRCNLKVRAKVDTLNNESIKYVLGRLGWCYLCKRIERFALKRVLEQRWDEIPLEISDVVAQLLPVIDECSQIPKCERYEQWERYEASSEKLISTQELFRKKWEEYKELQKLEDYARRSLKLEDYARGSLAGILFDLKWCCYFGKQHQELLSHNVADLRVIRKALDVLMDKMIEKGEADWVALITELQDSIDVCVQNPKDSAAIEALSEKVKALDAKVHSPLTLTDIGVAATMVTVLFGGTVMMIVAPLYALDFFFRAVPVDPIGEGDCTTAFRLSVRASQSLISSLIKKARS